MRYLVHNVKKMVYTWQKCDSWPTQSTKRLTNDRNAIFTPQSQEKGYHMTEMQYVKIDNGHLLQNTITRKQVT